MWVQPVETSDDPVDNLLPEFDSPPVTETVLAVGLTGGEVDLSHMIKFWSTVSDDYPGLEDQPPYQQPLERFDRRDRPGPSFEIDLSGMSRLRPRLWLKSLDESRVLQLQHDWVAFNWRKPPGSNVPYPRYSNTKEAFSKSIAKYFEFLDGQIVPTQCEVTYVNTIVPCSVWSSHSEASKVFSFLASGTPAISMAATESLNHYTTHRIEVDGRPVGRLHVTVSSVFDSAGNPIFVLNLTARGEPLRSRNLDGVFEFFDLGRKAIVRSFPELTTPSMHETWGRKS